MTSFREHFDQFSGNLSFGEKHLENKKNFDGSEAHRQAIRLTWERRRLDSKHLFLCEEDSQEET